jgi:hypothetical protein
MAGSIYIAKLYWNPVQQPLGMAILMFVAIVVMSICIYITAMFLLQKYYPCYDIFNEVKFLYKSLVGR